jgi:hypothetical protein
MRSTESALQPMSVVSLAGWLSVALGWLAIRLERDNQFIGTIHLLNQLEITLRNLENLQIEMTECLQDKRINVWLTTLRM